MSESSPNKTPTQLGYRWPAEWEPHEATWIAWPHNRETWPGKFERIPATFAKLVATLSQFEPVRVLAGGDALHDAAEAIGGLANVTVLDIETDDAWIRDYGPVFLEAPTENSPSLVDWQYNAWGEKYPPWDNDAAVGRTIAQTIGFQRFPVDAILEGGAIEGNGLGTILTTESCLLHPKRNPGLSHSQVDQLLAENFKATNILWLTCGAIGGDDTDGHIDQMARFVGPSTLVVSVEDDPNDVNYQPLLKMGQQLRTFSDQDGRPFDIISLPMPDPLFWQGQRLPASYANFYIANDAVVVPQFDDAADEVALGILNDLFLDREVLGFPSVDLVLGLGSIHCLTQQQPKSRESR